MDTLPSFSAFFLQNVEQFCDFLFVIFPVCFPGSVPKGKRLLLFPIRAEFQSKMWQKYSDLPSFEQFLVPTNRVFDRIP